MDFFPCDNLFSSFSVKTTYLLLNPKKILFKISTSNEDAAANQTLWWVAQIFGNICANKINTKATAKILIRKTDQNGKVGLGSSILSQLLINKFEVRMNPILTKTFAIFIVVSKILGYSSKLIILLNEGCFLVFKTFMSFKESEKKATSLPERKNDSNRRKITENNKITVAPELIFKSTNKRGIESFTE